MRFVIIKINKKNLFMKEIERLKLLQGNCVIVV